MIAVIEKAKLLELLTRILGLVIIDESRDIDQVSKVLEIIKERPDFAVCLAERFRPAAVEQMKHSLLQPLGTVIVPATTGKFFAREKFTINTGNGRASRSTSMGISTGVKISWIGDDFRTWFLPKVEEPIQKNALGYARLLKPALDGEIIADLGDHIESRLVQVHAAMEQQNGGSGALLKDGSANIFYIPDVNGKLRAVFAYQHGDGWVLNARLMVNPGAWVPGDRIFFSA